MPIEDIDDQDFMKMFNLTPPVEDPKTDPPTEEGGSTTPTADPEPTGETTEDPTVTDTKPTANPTETDNDPVDPENRFATKSNNAFAHMRTANKEMSNLIIELVKATGQNPRNIEEAQEMLRASVSTINAKARKIPEDVQMEMDNDKREIERYKQEQARQKALAGFKQVQSSFGLSKTELNGFVDELVQAGVNPFKNTDIDLVKEYRNMHFADLIKKAREQGVQDERERSTKAQASSTTPSTQKGLPDDTGSKGAQIKNVRELDKLLDS